MRGIFNSIASATRKEEGRGERISFLGNLDMILDSECGLFLETKCLLGRDEKKHSQF